MRLLSFFFAVLTISSVHVSAQDFNFCKYYAGAIFSTTNPTPGQQFSLIEAVVSRTLLGCNSIAAQSFSNSTCTGLGNKASVTGLLDVLSSNRGFFDGTVPNYNSVTGNQGPNSAAGIALANNGAGSIKFVNITEPFGVKTNAAAGPLINHLIEWFGRDLGCDKSAAYGDNNATGISLYGGYPSMTQVHKNMKINNTVWNGFVNALAGTLLSFGVTSDNVTNIITPYAKTFLRVDDGTSENVICNQPDCDCATGYSKNATNFCLRTVSSSSSSSSSSSTGGAGTPTTPNSNTGSSSGKNVASSLLASPLIILASCGVVMMMLL